MAKSSVPRHSKSARKSVTIELEPSSITKPASPSKTVPEPEPVGFDPSIGAKPAPSADTAQSSGASPGPQSFGRTEPGAQTKPAGAGNTASPPIKSDPLGRLASGFVGGVVALIGAAALQWAGVLPSPKTDISALEQQVAQLRTAPSLDETSQAALNDAATNAKQALDQAGGLVAELNAVKQTLSDMQGSAPAAGAPLDTSALDARIAALEQQLDASKQQVAQADGAAAGATARLDALEAKVNDTSGQTNMALAMAATGLKAAVDRGEPYTAELDTYIAVAPAAGDSEALRAGAAKGVPTVAALVGQFGEVAPKIMASTRTVDPSAGVLDRLWASASSLVEARPVGMVEGEGVDAVSARIEAHLNAGDLSAAIAEWDKLPADAKNASMEFGNAMKARQKASEVVAKALSDALSGIKTPAN